MLNDEQRNALFVEVHREIEAAATKASAEIAGLQPPDLIYPGMSRALLRIEQRRQLKTV